MDSVTELASEGPAVLAGPACADSVSADSVSPEKISAMVSAIQVDGAKISRHVDEVVRGTVEETLNALLDAEADRLCQASRYERSPDRQFRLSTGGVCGRTIRWSD